MSRMDIIQSCVCILLGGELTFHTVQSWEVSERKVGLDCVNYPEYEQHASWECINSLEQKLAKQRYCYHTVPVLMIVNRYVTLLGPRIKPH